MSDFYGPSEIVRSFMHRDVGVEIHEATKGATHCGTKHEFDKHRCDICGEQIFPKRVFLVFLNGSNSGIEDDSIDGATEAAMLCIDEDSSDDDDAIDFSQSDEGFPGANDGLLSDEAGKSDGISVGNPGMKHASLVQWMKKLGWGKKAARIAKESANKEPE